MFYRFDVDILFSYYGEGISPIFTMNYIINLNHHNCVIFGPF